MAELDIDRGGQEDRGLVETAACRVDSTQSQSGCLQSVRKTQSAHRDRLTDGAHDLQEAFFSFARIFQQGWPMARLPYTRNDIAARNSGSRLTIEKMPDGVTPKYSTS